MLKKTVYIAVVVCVILSCANVNSSSINEDVPLCMFFDTPVDNDSLIRRFSPYFKTLRKSGKDQFLGCFLFPEGVDREKYDLKQFSKDHPEIGDASQYMFALLTYESEWKILIINNTEYYNRDTVFFKGSPLKKGGAFK